MSHQPWISTAEICQQLAISRSTLFSIREAGLLKNGRHVVAKNPASTRSHLLWHLQRCELALGRAN
jgi:DNA-binding CsgD family transcriptional regulator